MKKDEYSNGTVNNIGDEGARMIGESLKTNTTLIELDLSGDKNIKKNIIFEVNRNGNEQMTKLDMKEQR